MLPEGWRQCPACKCIYTHKECPVCPVLRRLNHLQPPQITPAVKALDYPIIP